MVYQKRGMFLLVFAIFLTLSSVAIAETQGCYIFPDASEDLYCVNGILDTVAKADCENSLSCDFDQHFTPGSNCNEVPECKKIICNVDCQQKSLGKCTAQGGSPVPNEEFSLWCDPGCCSISQVNFCQFGLNKFQCEERARQRGAQGAVIFDNPPTMNAQACNELFCGVEIGPGRIFGVIHNGDQEPLVNARIRIQGTEFEARSDAAGVYSFPELNPGTYLLRVSAQGFTSSSLSISLSPSQELSQDFTLFEAQATAQFSGVVRTIDGTPILGATVSWRGEVNGQTFSLEDGSYESETIPPGTYTVLVSKIGFATSQQVIEIEGSFQNNVILQLAQLQGVSGRVVLDKGAQGVDVAVIGARIFIDGVFRGFSRFPDGSFEFSVPVSSQEKSFAISATHQDLESEPVEFVLSTQRNRAENIIVTLRSPTGVCVNENTELRVESLEVAHLKGKQAVQLNWERPCPEVIGYEIVRISNDGEEVIPLSPAQNTLLDLDVEWDLIYTYRITALYVQGRRSAPTSSIAINPGNELCDGKYHEDGWDTFCIVGDLETRRTVWTCTDQNQLQPSLECNEDEQGTDYCAKVSLRDAECKSDAACSIGTQPFGLYHSSEACYGNNAENFCVYDTTTSIIDQCFSCVDIETCFEYQSEGACVLDNCLGQGCKWIQGAQNNPIINYANINLPTTVGADTGAGYCVPPSYDDDDQCGLCSSTSNLFENYYCTAAVCTGLGECFSESDLQTCNSCGDEPTAQANCYSYNTQLECVGEDGSGISFDGFGNAVKSNDQCGWNRCLWRGEESGSGDSCVKDSNGDTKDDCASFERGGENSRCRVDNTPPKTTIVSQDIVTVSFASPNVSFFGDDGSHEVASQKNKMGTFSYCLTDKDAQNDRCDSSDKFTLFTYPGRTPQENIEVEIFNDPFLTTRETQPQGDTFKVKYFSVDKYFNRESVREGFIFVDNVVPRFTIESEFETTADTTNLDVVLRGLQEAAICSFELSQLFPQGEPQNRVVEIGEINKHVRFTNLPGVRYLLNATCTDANGNIYSDQDQYVFDLEQDIDIISPQIDAVLANAQVSFEVTTQVGAVCSLHLSSTNEQISNFISDEVGKHHRTRPIPGFIEKEYAGEYKVVCEEVLTQELHEDFFHFSLDFTPPETQIILQENLRTIRPLSFGWEEFFIEFTQVDFECTAQGFACETIQFCIGEACEIVGNPNYQEYTQSIRIEESTQICYFSTDAANNPVFQPLCGRIEVVGFGITLEAPNPHTFQGDMWGVSAEPLFTWQFSTRVPTTECRFDFTQNFEYENVPEQKRVIVNQERKYVVHDFPQSAFSSYSENGGIKEVFVQCQNLEGEVGPEQKMVLEFDPNEPTITRAIADPDELEEGTFTTLFVDTDSRTLCKYSDNSQGEGSVSFETMEFSFPGVEERELKEVHQSEFTISNVGNDGKKDFILATQCETGAGRASQIENILFSVDYTSVGFILEDSLQPSGTLRTQDVLLEVQTSRNAICEFERNREKVMFENGAGSKEHSHLLQRITEAEHIIAVTCTMGEHVAEGQIIFTIDRSAPQITSVEDGNVTCGSDAISVFVFTNEENIARYEYQVHDLGEEVVRNVSTRFAQAFRPGIPVLVLSGNATTDLPIQIPTVDLNNSHRYSVQVRAGDIVGNLGAQFTASDGVLVTDATHPTCLEDTKAPTINFVENASCTSNFVELHCEDATGCGSVRYGVDSSSEGCLLNKSYNGKKIGFDRSAWLCYAASDVQGNNKTGKRRVDFNDIDGDGISDECDNCSKSGAGRIVDDEGCASNEEPFEVRSQDNDADGLPNYWEDLYNTVECRLDPDLADSDLNGILDNLEDYDGDGFTNFQEFSAATNPCSASTSPQDRFNSTAAGTLFGSDDGPEYDVDDTTLPSQLGQEQGSILAWVFLIIGILMMGGGIGYLVYHYKYRSSANQQDTGSSTVTAAPPEPTNIFSAIKEKIAAMRRSHQNKVRSKTREDVFGQFTKESPQIPHLQEALSARSAHLPRLHTLAHHYADHKAEIKPGLRTEEKSVFNKLEQIAHKTKDAKIHEVVSKDEAKDIFGKLRDISKKRKVKQ